MFDGRNRPRRGDGVLAQQAAGMTLLLDPSSGEYFSLDEVGGRVWELCDGSRVPGEIASAICAEYEAPFDEVHGDVIDLLSELAAAALLEADD